MFNSEIPSKSDLPTTARLVKSTLIALGAALAILVAVVLPAEYAIDPTGVGRVLRLTDMGEIKQQLAIEAEADRARDRLQRPTLERRSGIAISLASLFISSAAASQPIILAQVAVRSDETVIKLRPNEGMEYKMVLPRGTKIEYAWRSEGGRVNYDMHGSPAGGGKEVSYKAGRDASAADGVLTAGFDGSHGWFWRNRGTKDVTITLNTKGAYAELRRVM